MTHIKYFLADFHACGYVRGEVLAREINKNAPNMVMDCKADILMSDFYKTNIMVFQRQFTDASLNKMRAAKQYGIKTVYEMDDDLLNIPVEFIEPYKFHSNPEVRKNIEAFIKEVDFLTVSTMPLAESVRRYTKQQPIFVVENFVDAEAWERGFITRQQSLQNKDKVVIGWMASGSHAIDAGVVRNVLPFLMNKFGNLHIHLIGLLNYNDFPELKPFENRVLCENWIGIDRLPQAMANFDIAICPLIRNPFNDCKSNIKWQQNACLEVPCVCSPGPVYGNIKNGIDGFLAENSDIAWINTLSELIEHKELRDKVGCKAREVVISNHDMRVNVSNWIDVYNRMLR